MSNLKDYYVSACNRRGFVTFTKIIWAESAIDATCKAERDLRRTNTEWWTIWTGDPARPGFMKTTREG